MDLSIQHPLYPFSMRLGEALLDACNNGKNGAGAFAFAEENGIKLFLGDPDFKEYIKEHSYTLIVGTDSITDPKAISSLRTYQKDYKNLTVYAFVHDARKHLFHPKTTWFETSTGGILLIGSGNLTERGLYHNIEFYGQSNLNRKEFDNIKHRWENWIEWCSENNLLFSIDDPIVDIAANLSALNKSRGFASVGKSGGGKSGSGKGSSIDPVLLELYKKQPKSESLKPPKTPKGTKTGTKPAKIKPASTIISRPIPTVIPIVVTSSSSAVWSINDDDRALVAEVPDGGRLSQVNFNRATFEGFFGATAGSAGGTFRIHLRSVDISGKLSEIESRPSVSAASGNYRFEIEAAKGLQYPSGGNRPYIVFIEVSTRSFLYEFFMPGSAGYLEVDKYVKAWKIANKKANDKECARITTTAKDIKGAAPGLGLWKI